MNRRRYPVRRHIYDHTTGRLLPRRISQILKELGFSVWINPRQGNDIDIKVWYEDTLVIVGEILNWSIVSELAEKRLRKMISNLKEYNCRRLVIYTHLDESRLLAFKESGIDTLGIGYQILPKYYYDFYASKGQVIGRKIDSRETRLDLKSKLIAYLRRNGFCI